MNRTFYHRPTPLKITKVMDALEEAIQPEDMNIPGFRFHGLEGNPKRYSLSVTGNWRITSRQMLYDILNESRPVTTAMALRLGKVLGNGPNVWVGMQQKYDLFYTAQDMADELDEMPILYG